MLAAVDAGSLAVLVGAVVFVVGEAVVVLWVLAARRRIRRARQAPAGTPTMELRPEPPPVVSFLVNRLTVTADAVAAALLDLAADGFVELFEVSAGTTRIRRLRHRSTPPQSSADRMLLERIDRAGGDLTLAELAESMRGTSFNDWSPFATGVRDDALARGLVHEAKDLTRVGPPILGAVLACVGMVVAAVGLLILTPIVFLGTVFTAALAAGGGLVLTDEGRAAATHWDGVRRRLAEGAFDEAAPAAVAVWDHYLAHAAALGVSRDATRSLVAEVRTRVTAGDLVELGGGIRTLWRLRRGPEAWTDLHRRHHLELFGPDVPESQLFGPEPTDWWELLEVTGRAWGVAGLVLGRDRAAWAAAAEARLDLLVDGAPPEVRDPIAVLVPSARTYLAMARGDVAEAPSVALFSTDEEQRAIDELVVRVAEHHGWEASRHAVRSGLLPTA